MKFTVLILVGFALGAYAGDKTSGTQFWNGPVEKVPEIPKVAPSPKPTPSPTATPPAVSLVQASHGVTNHQDGFARPQRQSNFSMQVGRSVPVPTAYSPPRVQNRTVIPATPTRFITVETGVSISNGSVSMTEFGGFINYGGTINTPNGRVFSPILVPVINRVEVR